MEKMFAGMFRFLVLTKGIYGSKRFTTDVTEVRLLIVMTALHNSVLIKENEVGVYRYKQESISVRCVPPACADRKLLQWPPGVTPGGPCMNGPEIPFY